MVEFPALPKWVDVITRVLKSGMQELRKRRQHDNRSRDCSGAATSQGVWMPLEVWKRQKTYSPPEPPEGTSPVDILILALYDLFQMAMEGHLIWGSKHTMQYKDDVL